MPKPMYVWSGSAWVSVATEVESLATYATQSYADNVANVASGLKLITPTSIAVGSGSGSVNTSGSVTFSGASSVSLNGVFSNTYNNYRIVVEAKTASGAGNIGARMRASGTDTTSGNYFRQALIAANTSVSASRNNSATSWDNVVTYMDNVMGYANILEIRSPFQSGTYTTVVSTTAHNAAGGSNEVWLMSHGINLTTQFDGITFIPSTSTISGNIAVYGYKI